MIERIKTKELADKCDELLTKLIQDEKQYDDSIDTDLKIINYFNNFVNDDNKVLLGYLIDDVLVGYTYAFEMVSNNVKGMFIDGLYVESDYRNRGIAKELINEVILEAEKRDAKFIDIKVMSKNDIAKKLYDSLDFNEFKIVMRKEFND
ncbi:MAG: GNAT family N-acetyltransferase [Bacilli bacterium]|nr:GNAT family N-acetyltransferase [Bacilli bacterium]